MRRSAPADWIIQAYFCIILGAARNRPLLNALTVGALLYMLADRPRGLWRALQTRYALWLIAFTLDVFLGALWAQTPDAALGMGRAMGKIAVMMLFICTYTRTPRRLALRLRQFLLALVFMMARVLLAHARGTPRLASFEAGAGLHFNSASQILAFAIILALWFVLGGGCAGRRAARWPYALFIALAYAVIVWSGSRKSVIIPAAGLLALVLLGRFGARRQARLLLAALALTAVAALCVAANDALRSRFWALADTLFLGGSSDASALERRLFREMAVELFLRHPILGAGADAFLHHLARIGYPHVAYCHNNALEVLVSFGALGGAVYYSFYLWAACRLAAHRRSMGRLGAVLLSLLLVFTAFEWGIVTYSFAIYHVLLCLMAVFIRCCDRAREARGAPCGGRNTPRWAARRAGRR